MFCAGEGVCVTACFCSSTHIASRLQFTLYLFVSLLYSPQVRKYVNDVARIYSISVSNAVDGVSSSCRACALSTQPSSSTCVPCPPGHYIDAHTSQCTECPPNTYLASHATPGPDACKPCGPGSKSDKVCWYEERNQAVCYCFYDARLFILFFFLFFLTGPQFMLQ